MSRFLYFREKPSFEKENYFYVCDRSQIRLLLFVLCYMDSEILKQPPFGITRSGCFLLLDRKES